MALAGLSGCLPRPRKRTTIRWRASGRRPTWSSATSTRRRPTVVVGGYHLHLDVEGWLFLSHVEDLFSRKIVGWADGKLTCARNS